MNFIQQVYRGENKWYHWLITIVLVVFGWQILGGVPILATALTYAENMTEFRKAAENNFLGLGIDSNLYLFLIIFSFTIGLLFLIIGVKWIHKRTATSLVTSRTKVDWKRFWLAFIIWGTLAVAITFIGILISPDDYIFQFKPKKFFILAAISFLFLPLQTSFEELLFRGYFMQGLGALAKNRWFPLIITSVCFGLLHGLNPEVEKLGWITMVFYIGTGFFYGIITLMDEGTELALGLHASNNIVAALLVSTDWTVFQTNALYLDISDPSVNWELFFPVFVLYPLMLIIFYLKYGWKNWKEKLFGKIEKLQIETDELY